MLSVTCKTEMKEKRQKEYLETSRVGCSRGRVRRMSTYRDKSEGQNEQDFAATGRESEGLQVHLCELFLEIKPCPQVGRLRCRKSRNMWPQELVSSKMSSLLCSIVTCTYPGLDFTNGNAGGG